jgi:hypothetical protein
VFSQKTRTMTDDERQALVARRGLLERQVAHAAEVLRRTARRAALAMMPIALLCSIPAVWNLSSGRLVAGLVALCGALIVSGLAWWLWHSKAPGSYGERATIDRLSAALAGNEVLEIELEAAAVATVSQLARPDLVMADIFQVSASELVYVLRATTAALGDQRPACRLTIHRAAPFGVIHCAAAGPRLEPRHHLGILDEAALQAFLPRELAVFARTFDDLRRTP